MEKEATPLADNGKTEEAREILTLFVQKKCDEAMTTCQKMLESLGNLPVLGKGAKTNLD